MNTSAGDQDPPPPHPDTAATPASGLRLSSDEILGPSPQYSQQSRSSHRADSDAVSITTLPPSYAAATSGTGFVDVERISSNSGKKSGRYHGVKYDGDDLWKAASLRNTSLMQKCFKAGVDVNYCRWVKKHRDLGSGVRSIADFVTSKNDIASMRLLLEYKVDLTGTVVSIAAANKGAEAHTLFGVRELELIENELWTTPLHEACKHGYLDMITLLLNEGGVSPHVTDHRQRTGLFVATKAKRVAAVELLMASGASIESENSGGVTPLASAAYVGSPAIVEILLRHGVQVDVADDRGETALFNAALRGHPEIVTQLAAYGASVDQRNLAGATAFFTAASNFQKEMMTVLVECGADTDGPDENGCTALLRAIMAKNMALAKFLLSVGADIDAPDDRGWTPLFAAMIHNDEDLLRLLLDNGCDIKSSDLHGNTPLHQAVMLNSMTTVRHILARQSHGDENHSQTNMFGETPLVLACKYDRSAMVKILLKHGSNPQDSDPDGYRALDRAMYWGNFACVRHLIEADATIDEQALLALQQGGVDCPGSKEGYKMIFARLKTRHGISSLPKTESPPVHLRDLFSQAITKDELQVRMRMKQKKNITTDPGLVPAGNASVMIGGLRRADDVASSQDPFEACIPKTKRTEFPNNSTIITASGSHATTALRAGSQVGQFAANVTSSILG